MVNFKIKTAQINRTTLYTFSQFVTKFEGGKKNVMEGAVKSNKYLVSRDSNCLRSHLATPVMKTGRV